MDHHWCQSSHTLHIAIIFHSCSVLVLWSASLMTLIQNVTIIDKFYCKQNYYVLFTILAYSPFHNDRLSPGNALIISPVWAATFCFVLICFLLFFNDIMIPLIHFWTFCSETERNWMSRALFCLCCGIFILMIIYLLWTKAKYQRSPLGNSSVQTVFCCSPQWSMV